MKRKDDMRGRRQQREILGANPDEFITVFDWLECSAWKKSNYVIRCRLLSSISVVLW